MTRRARAYEARVRARRFRAGLSTEADGAVDGSAADGGVDSRPDGGVDSRPDGGVDSRPDGGVDSRPDGGVADGGVAEDPRSRGNPPDPTPRPAGASPLVGPPVQVLDGEPFTVRPVTGAAAAKVYVCPRCLQAIPPRVPHVVVWPVHTRLDGAQGLSVRRHWHRHCWASHVRTSTSGRAR